MRVATIDIGTNTVLLLIAERPLAKADADGRRASDLVALLERATITRLGQGVDQTHALAPEAIARTTACLDAYARDIADAKVDRVDVVGTSAMRDARGGDAIREHVKRVIGVDARVIGGEEEARLTFSGALVGLGGARSRATVFDIGGGSTEVVQGSWRDDARTPPPSFSTGVADPSASPADASSAGGASADCHIDFARSFDVGSVRMTERHVKSDPPTRAERDAITEDVNRIVSELPPLTPPAPEPGRVSRSDGRDEPVGIAGTVTTLAAVAMDLDPYDATRVHGARLDLATLETVVERLSSLTLEERRKVRGLEPKRADVIVAGGLITVALLKRWGATSLRVSDRGVRWGLALALCK